MVAALAAGLYGKAPIVKGRSPVAPALLSAVAAFSPLLLAALIQARLAGLPIVFPVLCTLWIAMVMAVTRIVLRLTLAALVKHGYCIDRCIVLAPTDPAARLYAATLDRLCNGRLRTVASLAMPQADAGAFLAWIEACVRRADADQFIIVQAGERGHVARSVTWQMVRLGADVTVIPEFGAPRRFAASPSLSADVPPLDSDPAPLSRFQAGLKRAFDVVVAIILLASTSPIWAMVALTIKLGDGGTVFFRQDRHGRQGRVFRIWKFRTMRAAAAPASTGMQTSRNDVRVTRVGKFLRKASLDELPQLLNVLAGDMSIVGPRPHAVGMLVAGEMPFSLLDEYDVRHDVKPGITGWAQVNGSRGELDSARSLRRRFALDRFYIENWSIGLDAVIVLRTAILPFTDRVAC